MPIMKLGKVTGAQGPQGVPGVAGAQGIQGIQGPAGEAGKSAYQAARDGGYTGTEAEFNAILAIIEKHAGRHKVGGADPLTAADVGAVAKPNDAVFLSSSTVGLASLGWHRVMIGSGVFSVAIYSEYNTIQGECFAMRVALSSYGPFIVIDGKNGYGNYVFKKVRLVLLSTGEIALDIHYSYYNGNRLFASAVGVNKNASATMPGWTLVDEVVEGETVLVTQDIRNMPSGNVLTDNTKVRKIVDSEGNTIDEWYVPNMQLGAEYRTTERFEGKPVYVKALTGRTIAATGTTDFAHGIKKKTMVDGVEKEVTALDCVIEVYGTAGMSPLTGYPGVTGISASADNLTITTSGAVSVAVKPVIKYVKTS